MDNPYTAFWSRPFHGFVGVLAWPRSYANLAYLLLAFPIGLAWFVLYVTGVALGVGTLVLGIGVVILLALAIAAHGLARFEREIANVLLDARVPPVKTNPPIERGIVDWLKSVLTHPVTWKGLGFQLVRFPLGLASWILAVVLLALVGGLVFAPVVDLAGGSIDFGAWRPAGWETLVVSAIGIVLLPVVVHLLNGAAWLWGAFARVALGQHADAPRAAASSAVPATKPSG